MPGRIPVWRSGLRGHCCDKVQSKRSCWGKKNGDKLFYFGFFLSLYCHLLGSGANCKELQLILWFLKKLWPWIGGNLHFFIIKKELLCMQRCRMNELRSKFSLMKDTSLMGMDWNKGGQRRYSGKTWWDELTSYHSYSLHMRNQHFSLNFHLSFHRISYSPIIEKKLEVFKVIQSRSQLVCGSTPS